MTARGRVHNGVVVLDDGVCFPEGQEVTVVGHGTAPAGPSLEGSPSHSVLEIPTVSLGAVLCARTPDDDLLGEMLEGRP
jgi:hypothetical protein